MEAGVHIMILLTFAEIAPDRLWFAKSILIFFSFSKSYLSALFLTISGKEHDFCGVIWYIIVNAQPVIQSVNG